jgi:hypothetical protein
VNELDSLFNPGESNPASWLETQGFTNVQESVYHSSTTVIGITERAWSVDMGHSRASPLAFDDKVSMLYVWPVRLGLTAENEPPTAPALLSPANNTTGVNPNNVMFQWNPSTDPDGDAIEYCIILNEDAEPDDIPVFTGCDDEVFTSDTSLELTIELEPGKKYWWAVWAKDQQGNWSEASEWWNFTTASPVVNQPPVIDFFTANLSDTWLVVQVGNEVTFVCVAHDPDGSIQAYTLDYGDGSTPETNFTGEFTYAYTDPGIYQATCAVMDDESATTVSQAVIVLVRKPKFFGLFVGPRSHPEGFDPEKGDLRGDLTAEDVSKKFENLGDVPVNKLITNKYWAIDQYRILSAIRDEIKPIIQPGDVFVMYIVGHGDSEWFGGDEPTEKERMNSGDEYIWLRYVSVLDPHFLTDDELTSYLDEHLPNVQKWIFIDACDGGGFWGDKDNPWADEGDLEKLSNISIIASAKEGEDMHYIGENNPPGTPDIGKTIFGIALREAWSKGSNGRLNSDLNEDGLVTFDELKEWLISDSPPYREELDGIFVREGDFGDESIYSSDMWDPMSEKSDDFIGVLLTDSPDNPSASAGGPYSGEAGFPITFDASGSNTPNQSIILYEWDWENDGIFDVITDQPTITHTWYELYSGTVRLQITDNEGLTEIDSASVEIIDTTPPTISVSISPDTLWPPNHKMVLVTPAITATDNCSAAPTIQLTAITMNEGEETNTFDSNYDYTMGDGHTIDDIQVSENNDIYLRAERSGTGTGRIYTITYIAIDASGNTATASATVNVPHNQ